MKPEEINLYRDIQRNAESSIRTIETICDIVYDEEVARQMSRQALKYTDIKNKAIDKLLGAKAEPVHKNHLNGLLEAGNVHLNTFLNTSTSHIAEFMILENNKRITNMCKSLNHNSLQKSMSTELAKELVAFEEKNISIYKKYL